jgi:high-affinity iron transporter
MASTIFIVWRESIEAMLVIGILYAWLKNQHAASTSKNTNQGMRYLISGIGAGIILALLLATIMLKIQTQLASESLEYFQLVMVLLAAVLIVKMVFWMRRHGRHLKQHLETGMQRASDKRSYIAMAVLAAIAVGREGAETVIFLYGTGLSFAHNQTANSGDGFIAFIGGASAGFILAYISFLALSKGTRYFSWQLFFKVSEALLLLLAAALIVDSVDKMIALDWLPALIDPVWDTRNILDDSSRFGGVIAAFTGYRAQPALMIVLVYIGYWLMIKLWLIRTNTVSARQTKTLNNTTQNAMQNNIQSKLENKAI